MPNAGSRGRSTGLRLVRAAAALAILAAPDLLAAEERSWILPSAVHRSGANGAEFRSDVRVLNPGIASVTVAATFYDHATRDVVAAPPFELKGRAQASWDNVLQSLFGRTIEQGSFGPVRFRATGPIVVSSAVDNVRACGGSAVSGLWLPGIEESQAMTSGVLAQLAASGSTASGTRTNVAFVNPGPRSASLDAIVRRGDGTYLSSGRLGPIPANGIRQVELDSPAAFPGVAGTTDTDLWLEYASDEPVLAFASVVDNVSGDPFAVLPSPVPPDGAAGAGEATVTLPGGVPLAMVRIPAGTFRMGSPESERGRSPDEGPAHEVTIPRDFWVGRTEVTQAQWRAVMGSVPSLGHGAGDSYPVYYVSWNDVAGPGGFLERANASLAGPGLRLPTEAEWEYAARAGTSTPFSFGDDESCSLAECGACALFNEHMWCSGSRTGYGSWPVGRKAPNAWGLFDVHGNVWEWVEDCYHPGYAGAPPDGRAWVEPGCADRVLRSGHWHGPAQASRSANRSREAADFLRVVNGFRVARSVE